MNVEPSTVFTHFATAEAFVNALYPLHRRWGSIPSDWIFRGHGDASWQLFPTAHRSASRSAFLDPHDCIDEDPVFLNHRVEHWEKELVGRALRAFDEAGVEVPGPSNLDHILLECFRDHSRPWPPPEAVPFMAFAQHHGIPTRLLDWTRRGIVAAYFAAEFAARCRTPSGNLEVIAIDWGELRAAGEAFGARLAAAPRSSNPNLHAQSGVFTIAGHEVSLGERIENWSQSVERQRDRPTTLMQRLTLPQNLAGEVLHLLAWHGITGAALFPGPHGVVRALQERCRWSTLAHEREDFEEDPNEA